MKLFWSFKIEFSETRKKIKNKGLGVGSWLCFIEYWCVKNGIKMRKENL